MLLYRFVIQPFLKVAWVTLPSINVSTRLGSYNCGNLLPCTLLLLPMGTVPIYVIVKYVEYHSCFYFKLHNYYGRLIAPYWPFIYSYFFLQHIHHHIQIILPNFHHSSDWEVELSSDHLSTDLSILTYLLLYASLKWSWIDLTLDVLISLFIFVCSSPHLWNPPLYHSKSSISFKFCVSLVSGNSSLKFSNLPDYNDLFFLESVL